MKISDLGLLSEKEYKELIEIKDPDKQADLYWSTRDFKEFCRQGNYVTGIEIYGHYIMTPGCALTIYEIQRDLDEIFPERD